MHKSRQSDRDVEGEVAGLELRLWGLQEGPNRSAWPEFADPNQPPSSVRLTLNLACRGAGCSPTTGTQQGDFGHGKGPLVLPILHLAQKIQPESIMCRERPTLQGKTLCAREVSSPKLTPKQLALPPRRGAKVRRGGATPLWVHTHHPPTPYPPPTHPNPLFHPST